MASSIGRRVRPGFDMDQTSPNGYVAAAEVGEANRLKKIMP
jgi:hypothetical protein